MTERPILFSGPMVRAILAGHKTQTRRVVKSVWGNHPTEVARCPYGVPGDRLWVREAWRLSTTDDCACYEPCHCRSGLPMYRADSDCPDEDGPWKPSIHMPRWASRITLDVTGVRVERVQDITEADAMAEGCEREDRTTNTLVGARVIFSQLWDSINAARGYGWDANPWVWVVGLRRIETRHCPMCGINWTPETGALSSKLCVECHNKAIACTPTAGQRREWTEAQEEGKRR